MNRPRVWIWIAASGIALVALAACAAGRGQEAEGAQRGREVFMTECYGCHTLGGAGTPIAPDLSRIGARLSREALETRIRDPRTHQAAAHMPRLHLRDADVRALGAYLSELR
jgi:putative heme-binding domain-containing protein